MRSRSGEWDGSTEKKDMFEWSDVFLPAKQGHNRGGLVKSYLKSRKVFQFVRCPTVNWLSFRIAIGLEEENSSHSYTLLDE